MSKNQFGPSKEGNTAADAFADFIGGAARFILTVGALAAIVGLGFELYYYFTFDPAAAGADQIRVLGMLDTFKKIALVGLVGLGVGSSAIYWGESFLPVMQVCIGVFVVCLPLILPVFSGNLKASDVMTSASAGFTTQGTVFCGIAAFTVLSEVLLRVRTRVAQGFKADQIKFGKGVKEEVEKQNVFMGKCWQLPYCRKFVRERCPIYHSRRSCWREKVGCMCEEDVIKNAMENRIIPRDMVAAAKYIPVNNKLTFMQKRERCKSCVIYNEHQKHKYKLLLPLLTITFIGITGLGWSQLNSIMDVILQKMDKVVNQVTMQHGQSITQTVKQSPFPIQSVFVACIMLILFAYALKGLEFCVFKLKV